MRRLPPIWFLILLTGLNLFNYLDRYVMSSVLESVGNDWNLSDTDRGNLGTAFMLGYFLTSPFFGYLGDRASRKWLIAFGVAVWCAGTVLSGFAAGFGMMLAFRILVGVGEASYGTISPGVLTDVYPPEKRNNVLTIFYMVIPVGAALGSLLGGLFENWRHAFIYAGLPGLLLAVALLPFADPPRLGSDQSHKPGLREIAGLFREPNYLLVVWGYAAYSFTMGAFAHWGPTFFQRSLGMAKETAGTYFGAILVSAGFLGTLLGGFAATRLQKKTPAGYALVLGLSVVLAAPLAYGAFQVADRTLSTCCFAAAVFLLFTGTGPVNTLILETAPAHLRSCAMAGSIFIIHMFGDLWSPAIVGHLSDRFGSLQKGVLVLPVALLVAAVLWLALAVRQRRKHLAAAVEG